LKSSRNTRNRCMKMKSGSPVKMRVRRKKKKKTLSKIVRSVSPRVRIRRKTEEISPMNIPGLECEGTEIGVAEVEGKKTAYIRLRLKF